MSVDELGSLSGDDDVTGERDFESSGDGEAVDGGDDGLFAALHLGDRVGLDVLDVAFENVLGGGEIDAGAEGPTRTREDNDPDRIVLVEGLEDPGEIRVHSLGEGVEQLGTVDRDVGDAVRFAVHEDEIFRRRLFPVHFGKYGGE